MDDMRAILRSDYGSANVLKLEQIEKPTVGDDQVLLRVHGSSVNLADRLVMQGKPYLLRLMVGLFRPRSPGMGQDVAGRVEAVGAKVADWVVGDELFGQIEFGAAWAEYLAAPAKALARAPKSIPLAQAGAVPLAALTALQAVRDQGRVQPGQRVLVNGGSGSVGSYIVQIAAALGAEVTAVCSARNAARAREFGASHVVDYAQEDFTQAPPCYDVLFDVIGNHPLDKCLGVVKPEGAYVVVGGPTDDPWLRPVLRPIWLMVRGLFVKQRVAVFVATPSRADLDTLTEMIGAGTLAPAFDSQCELAELPAAMGELESGERRGKLLISMG